MLSIARIVGTKADEDSCWLEGFGSKAAGVIFD